jgi:hypothetical protein
MTIEHPLLAGIRESVLANGIYSHHWGELRREVFPGQPAWINLRAWCIDNGLECDLTFGEASKEAEVQFRKADPATIANPAPVITTPISVAPIPG